MDDTFAFRSTGRPLRRRVDPVALKAALAAFVVVLAVGLFARWVIASERASERHVPRETEHVGVQILSGAEAVASQAPAGRLPEDVAAQDFAMRSLAAARKLFGHGGAFADAGPGALRVHGVTFTDGPSPAPSIVSLATSDEAWAAAVMSDAGTCFLLRAAPRGAVTYGATTDPEGCTGAGALLATDADWPSA